MDVRSLLLFLALPSVSVHSFQLVTFSLSDSSSDRTMTYAGAAFSFTLDLTSASRRGASCSIADWAVTAGIGGAVQCSAASAVPDVDILQF